MRTTTWATTHESNNAPSINVKGLFTGSHFMITVVGAAATFDTAYGLPHGNPDNPAHTGI